MRRPLASPLGSESSVDALTSNVAVAHVKAAVTQADSDRTRAAPQGDTAGARPSQPHAASTGSGSMALTAVGIVFGDIGTSPLYAFSVALSGTGRALPVAADVLGIVSLIFWALIVMVSLKYVVLVLRADNDGEGGILALLSLVAGDRIAWSPRLPLLVLLGVTGAALLYGDGVITPAISVLSAMEGLKLIAPAFEQFHRAGHDRDPDRTIHDPAARDPKHRQAVWTGHARLVHRHWSARSGAHLGRPGDPQGGQSGRGRTLPGRQPDGLVRGDRRRSFWS